jgi:aminoglycoside 2'-N-acetyltransferase I
MTALAVPLRRDYEMGALATSVAPFYEALGWERWAGPTFVRRGADRVRTEDEDGGIFVLRFGASATVELTESIMCEARRGDDW